MFNPFKAAMGGIGGQLFKQAQQMQEALAQEEVIVDKQGVRIVMSGDQKVKEILIDGTPEERVADAVEEALKKTQALAAQQLMSLKKS